MADFRKWFYALAVMALLASFAVPAAAQQPPPFQCVANAAVPPVVRGEGYTELVGDLTLNCSGGVPTPQGLAVPQVNVTIFLNTNVTSKYLQGGLFNEALLIIDEPNSAVFPARPILNCGNTGAADAGPSGPAVCEIFSIGNPGLTYDGTPGVQGITPAVATLAGLGGSVQWTVAQAAAFCTAPSGGLTTGSNDTGLLNGGVTRTNIPICAAPNGYGFGRPNVFQGRTNQFQNNQLNLVTWNGVPLDPPGTTTTRTLRITNVRADAERLGVSSTFVPNQITMNISINGNTSLSINNPFQIVAYVQNGLRGGVQQSNLNFVQCNSENPDVFNKTIAPAFGANEGFNIDGFGIGATATVPASQPLVRLIEGFASSWKVKNLSFDLGAGGTNQNLGGNAVFNPATNFYTYNGGVNYPTDAWQNVPGAIYNTESGFEFSGSTANSVTQQAVSPNPPQGFGTFQVTANTVALASTKLNNQGIDTGIAGAGVANHGTRLVISFTNIPQGAAVFVPPIVYLQRQFIGYPNGLSTTTPSPASNVTGVMVLTATQADGSGNFSRVTSGTGLQQVTTQAVYEVLYADPFSLEYADVPVVVAFVSNLSQNLPQVGVTAQAAIGFAPFFANQNTAGIAQPVSSTGVGVVPRFIPGQAPQPLFVISKCACNLLYPYVVSQSGYDTGIALANTSLDPGPTFGFFATPQSGNVTFFYFGQGANGAAPPASQKTNKVVPAGQVLTYVASSGNSDFGLDNRAAGFVGYVITQAEFQWCHAYAFIGALGAGAVTPGQGTVSEGYLAIQIDLGGLNRTAQASENKAH